MMLGSGEGSRTRCAPFYLLDAPETAPGWAASKGRTHDCKRPQCRTQNYLLPGGGHPHMKRREFITGLALAVMWPTVASAQQSERMRRIGVFFAGAADANDADTRSRLAAFQHGLQQLAGAMVATSRSIIAGAGAMQPSFADTPRSWSRCRRMSSSAVAPPQSRHCCK